MSRPLSDCELTELEQQRYQLVTNSDDDWKETIYYKQRLAEIDRCIKLITKE
jgi:hypothetical protein